MRQITCSENLCEVYPKVEGGVDSWVWRQKIVGEFSKQKYMNVEGIIDGVCSVILEK
jgi:hypothetical protein